VTKDACVPMVMIFDEALVVDQTIVNAETTATDHVITSDFRLSIGER